MFAQQLSHIRATEPTPLRSAFDEVVRVDHKSRFHGERTKIISD
jgi:hypothetical protein